MKKFYLLSILSLFALVFVSCNKNDDMVTLIEGDYAIAEINADLTAEGYSDERWTPQGSTMKSVINEKFITKNIEGAIKIGGSKIAVNNLSYNANIDKLESLYINGILSEQNEITRIQEIVTYNEVVNCKIVGTDSIHFETNNIYLETGNLVLPFSLARATGAKYKIDGNKLILTMNLNFKSRYNHYGNVILTLERK